MSPHLQITVHRESKPSRLEIGCEADAQRQIGKQLVKALTGGFFEPRAGKLRPPTQQDPAPTARSHPALSPWQIRQLRLHLESNIGAKITTQSLARIARLSPSHFSRAFTVSFGNSPHRYLLQRRMERSQELMLTTTAPIVDIALDCGLVDQAHFGRLFRRLVGETPAAWRRARSGAAKSLTAAAWQPPGRRTDDVIG
jgi:transcriptional regulator GlxA family with amidase domain